MGSQRTESPALSREDVALLSLLAEGLPLGAVARRLCTSERTVRLRTPIQAVVWAAQRGIL